MYTSPCIALSSNAYTYYIPCLVRNLNALVCLGGSGDNLAVDPNLTNTSSGRTYVAPLLNYTQAVLLDVHTIQKANIVLHENKHNYKALLADIKVAESIPCTKPCSL